MTTTPTAIDEQIARLKAKREQIEAERDAALIDLKSADTALGHGVTETLEDVQAVRELPALLTAYMKACREWHRVTTGQRLRRRNIVVAGPVADVVDPALD